MTMIAEGAESKRLEEAVEKRKRKIDADKHWEGALASFSLSSLEVASLTR